MTSVLKRLEEIEHPSGPVSRETLAVRVSWLLRLTRALLESQGELAHQLHNACGCGSCEELIARAERVRRGEV